MRKHLFYFSILFILLVSCSPLKQYSRESYAWAIPEIEAFKAQNTKAASEGSLLFLGSSSIRLWKTLARDMAPHPIIQRGYGGAHLRDAIFFPDALLGEYDPKMIIGFFANDIKGVPEDERPQRVKRLFKFFINQVRERNPNVPLLWIEITPTQSRWEQWEKIQSVNNKIKSFCDKTANLYFVETASAFLDDQGRPRTELFVEDQLHLNPDGYAVWSQIIRKEIEKHLN